MAERHAQFGARNGELAFPSRLNRKNARVFPRRHLIALPAHRELRDGAPAGLWFP
jgi:hypothetical protein